MTYRVGEAHKLQLEISSVLATLGEI
jgi:hypothetical protein